MEWFWSSEFFNGWFLCIFSLQLFVVSLALDSPVG